LITPSSTAPQPPDSDGVSLNCWNILSNSLALYLKLMADFSTLLIFVCVIPSSFADRARLPNLSRPIRGMFVRTRAPQPSSR
jgi:hypothetical protein